LAVCNAAHVEVVAGYAKAPDYEHNKKNQPIHYKLL